MDSVTCTATHAGVAKVEAPAERQGKATSLLVPWADGSWGPLPLHAGAQPVNPLCVWCLETTECVAYPPVRHWALHSAPGAVSTSLSAHPP